MTWFHHCAKCSFDLCKVCIADRQKVPASEFEHDCLGDLEMKLEAEEAFVNKLKKFKSISEDEDLLDVRCPNCK